MRKQLSVDVTIDELVDLFNGADILDIESKEEFPTMWQEDVYNRLMELIDKDKLTPQQWEKFLNRYE